MSDLAGRTYSFRSKHDQQGFFEAVSALAEVHSKGREDTYIYCNEKPDSFFRIRVNDKKISHLSYHFKPAEVIPLYGGPSLETGSNYITTVGNPFEANKMIVAMGHRLVLNYEKIYQAFAYKESFVSFDILPFGYYAKIQAPTLYAVNQTEKQFRFGILTVENRTYPELTELYGSEIGTAKQARFKVNE